MYEASRLACVGLAAQPGSQYRARLLVDPRAARIEKIPGLSLRRFCFVASKKINWPSTALSRRWLPCAPSSVFRSSRTRLASRSRGYPGTYRRSVPLALRWSTLGALALLAVAVVYLLTGQRQLGFGFLLAALIFPRMHAISQWKGVYLGEGKFNRFSVAESSNALVKTVLIMCHAVGVSGLLSCTVVVFLAFRRCRITPDPAVLSTHPGAGTDGGRSYRLWLARQPVLGGRHHGGQPRPHPDLHDVVADAAGRLHGGGKVCGSVAGHGAGPGCGARHKVLEDRALLAPNRRRVAAVHRWP